MSNILPQIRPLAPKFNVGDDSPGSASGGALWGSVFAGVVLAGSFVQNELEASADEQAIGFRIVFLLTAGLALATSLLSARRAPTPNGTYVITGDSGGRWLGGFGDLIRVAVWSPFVSQRIAMLVSMDKNEVLGFLKEFIEAGKVTPVIDRTYPLSEVPEAIGYMEDGHARGKVVITV